MTPDERDRLARLEANYVQMKEWMQSISTKVDELRTVAHMGKGALWLFLKVGGLLLVIIGGGWAVFEKFHK